MCRSDLEIGSKNKSAKEKHASTDKQKLHTRSANSASILSHFAPENSASIHKSTAAVLCKVHYAVQHPQSYGSLDCGIKLDRVLYVDSTVTKGITCGRTKAQLLRANVLAPYSLKSHFDYI